MIIRARQWLNQNMNNCSNLQKTSHTSASRASYVVSNTNSLEKKWLCYNGTTMHNYYQWIHLCAFSNIIMLSASIYLGRQNFCTSSRLRTPNWPEMLSFFMCFVVSLDELLNNKSICPWFVMAWGSWDTICMRCLTCDVYAIWANTSRSKDTHTPGVRKNIPNDPCYEWQPDQYISQCFMAAARGQILVWYQTKWPSWVSFDISVQGLA